MTLAMAMMEVVLNWLWQGAALLAVVGLAVWVRGRALNAATRERIWWMTLLAVLGIPVLHLLTFLGEGPAVMLGEVSDLVRSRRLVVTVPDTVHVIVGTLWAAWVAASTIRLVWGGLQVRSARRLARPVGPGRERRLRTWTQIRGQGRSTALVTSQRVHRAAVLGLGKPLIALAPEMLARLTDDELDQIVVHEYAHVQRRDDLAMFLQRAIVAVAGVHPAVWWLDRALNTEREVACDDWVLAHTGSAKQYATCLVGLAAAGRAPWGVSPGAMRSTSQLSTRVARMLDHGRNQTVTRSRPVLLIARLATIGFAVSAGVLPLVEVARYAEHTMEPYAAADPPLGGRGITQVPAVPGRDTLNRVIDLEAGQSPRAEQDAAEQELQVATASIGQALLEDVAPAITVLPAFALAEMAIPAFAAASSTQAMPDATLPLRQAADWSSVVVAPGGPAGVATPLYGDHDHEIPETAPFDATWRPAAEAATAFGEGSRDAAVKTAKFFGNLGKSIAGSF